MKFLTVIFALAAANAQDAKTSFTKTMAAGTRSWTFGETTVEHESKTGKQVFKCKNKYPVTLKGEFPNVTFNVGGLDCGSAKVPSELAHIGFLATDIGFEAKHIPVASDPNQFRLFLTKRSPVSHPKMKDLKSLNALTRDNELTLDLSGEDVDHRVMMTSKYIYLTISILRGQGGKPDQLRVYYQYDEHGPNRRASETEFVADLIPR